MILNIIGDEYGSIVIFTVFGFGPFLAIFGHFWHFLGFSGDLGVFGVQVSYKISRGIKLVVGRVTEGVKRGLREFWRGFGGYGGVKGGLLDPYKASFAPREDL